MPEAAEALTTIAPPPRELSPLEILISTFADSPPNDGSLSAEESLAVDAVNALAANGYYIVKPDQDLSGNELLSFLGR